MVRVFGNATPTERNNTTTLHFLDWKREARAISSSVAVESATQRVDSGRGAKAGDALRAS